MTLIVENLVVKIAERKVLDGVNLKIPDGETHILLGPNGSGKTSLIMSILGFPRYKVISGKIELDGKDITKLTTDERARLGIGVAFQNPPSIRGIKLGEVFNHLSKGQVDGAELAKATNVPGEFLERDINM
jgi:Fe-S cluster assembly ATP-binding protein